VLCSTGCLRHLVCRRLRPTDTAAADAGWVAGVRSWASSCGRPPKPEAIGGFRCRWLPLSAAPSIGVAGTNRAWPMTLNTDITRAPRALMPWPFVAIERHRPACHRIMGLFSTASPTLLYKLHKIVFLFFNFIFCWSRVCGVHLFG
jgi:hypothetical protein